MPPAKRDSFLPSKKEEETPTIVLDEKERNDMCKEQSVQSDSGLALESNNDAVESDKDEAKSDDSDTEMNEKLEGNESGERGSRKMTRTHKLNGLSHAALAAANAAVDKAGVIYLSRIPPFMKPQKLKHLLSQYGEIGRVFLAPEDPKSYAKRVHFGGNKKKNYTEGWVEFKDKRKSKMVAGSLNGTIIGGKKGNFYHDDLWNMKYLPKFKWHHLTEQIAYENASRQARMRTELSQAAQENKAFVKNVERSKMIANMKAQKQERAGSSAIAEPVDVRRQFRQRKVAQGAEPKDTGDGYLQRVWGKLFA
ncbi:Pre-rRNA-processing protein ESF2 [Neolecta irregularis DAH-3]|uniref:18S rRNA factor 2 n=1 Tax=Neolecta irregularis (strain DAH-3) TaxID=1198029 RepID=A0A1U7LVK0_NEOID|nr:Pre-rRNA-processing protein ESF2 [Neolecta irregularis DAH-3]|eukprot:OLL26706.1 Pre-rRNA-processing protein ESF2 [Neolecta irregularis DAH-3]